MADTKYEVILGMLFLKISNTDIAFGEGTLMWKFYTTSKALLTTKQVQLVDQKEFVMAALDMDSKTFIGYMAICELEKMIIDPGRKTQIEAQSGAQVRALLFNKASTKIPAEYSDYNNVFSTKNTVELLENIGINEHAIKLEEDKQPSFRSFYSLGPVKLETLKTYIKTNWTNGFILLSKSLARAPISFDKKPDGSLYLYVDYQGLNNITIKNQYPLPLIGK